MKDDPEIKKLYLAPHGNIPNNPHLPVLLYQQLFPEPDNLADRFKDVFAKNNWGGSWVNGVFDYHHYHSKSHEVLGVADGSAILILGGPGGEETAVKAGDMVVLPAGTGHCLKSDSPNFKVVGAYPGGQENYDICTEQDDPQEKQKNITQVALPKADPVFGERGPLLQYWTE